MNTFLPYPSFERTAEVLDDRRLGKQRVEAYQILRALHGATRGWVAHPAVRMWRGYECCLLRYLEAITDEWIRRGHADTVAEKAASFHRPHCRGLEPCPPWLGDPSLHRSHRSNLKRKDPSHYGPRFEEDLPDDLPYLWPAPDRA